MSEDREKLVDRTNFVGVPEKLFSSKYIVDKCLDIVVELALNIKINCKLQGASEALIEQHGAKKSAIVPLNYKDYKNIKDNPKGYYAQAHFDYPNMIIERRDSRFDKFVAKELTRQDPKNSTSQTLFPATIGFKAVNYRSDIYTGRRVSVENEDGEIVNINNVLNGEDFHTHLEKREFHTEFIANKVFVLLEVKNKFYYFAYDALSDGYIFLEDENIKNIKQFIDRRYIVTYVDPEAEKDKGLEENAGVQYIFVHLSYNGSSLEFKEIQLDNQPFKNDGKFKNV